MADTDTVAAGDPQQLFARYSDSELLAFWAATETMDEVDTAPETAREAALIGVAWQELARRSLITP